MQTFCEFGKSESDGNSQAKTPTRFPTPPQIKNAVNTKWVSSIRGCAAIEGDGSNVWCNKKSEIPTLILPKVRKQRLNQAQVETTHNNSNTLKLPKEPPPKIYTKQTLSNRERQRCPSSEGAGRSLVGTEGASGTKLARERVC